MSHRAEKPRLTGRRCFLFSFLASRVQDHIRMFVMFFFFFYFTHVNPFAQTGTCYFFQPHPLTNGVRVNGKDLANSDMIRQTEE